MARWLYVVVGLACYLIFFATFLYLIAFVGDLPGALRTVDVGPLGPMLPALVVDAALILVFGLQHSAMARPAFKAWWTRIIPKAIERSVYVLFSSVALILMFAFWRPLPHTIWAASGIGAIVLWALFASGWLIVLLSTYLINHFELFGLKQVWANLRARPEIAPRFVTPLFYRLVRHPLYSGFILAFWAIPVMTAGHLLLAAGMSVYVLIAISYEERDMVGVFGAEYEQYQAQVGMLAPGIGRRRVRSSPQ